MFMKVTLTKIAEIISNEAIAKKSDAVIGKFVDDVLRAEEFDGGIILPMKLATKV